MPTPLLLTRKLMNQSRMASRSRRRRERRVDGISIDRIGEILKNVSAPTPPESCDKINSQLQIIQEEIDSIVSQSRLRTLEAVYEQAGDDAIDFIVSLFDPTDPNCGCLVVPTALLGVMKPDLTIKDDPTPTTPTKDV